MYAFMNIGNNNIVLFIIRYRHARLSSIGTLVAESVTLRCMLAIGVRFNTSFLPSDEHNLLCKCYCRAGSV